RTQDVKVIRSRAQPRATDGELLDKESFAYSEAIQDILRAENLDGAIVGLRALHVISEDPAEVSTLPTAHGFHGPVDGCVVLNWLLDKSQDLGVQHVFCLTIEPSFFQRHGFEVMNDQPVLEPAVFNQLLLSTDEGVAEFLDLARVKPNTLGNTRMIVDLAKRPDRN